MAALTWFYAFAARFAISSMCEHLNMILLSKLDSF